MIICKAMEPTNLVQSKGISTLNTLRNTNMEQTLLMEVMAMTILKVAATRTRCLVVREQTLFTVMRSMIGTLFITWILSFMRMITSMAKMGMIIWWAMEARTRCMGGRAAITCGVTSVQALRTLRI